MLLIMGDGHASGADPLFPALSCALTVDDFPARPVARRFAGVITGFRKSGALRASFDC